MTLTAASDKIASGYVALQMRAFCTGNDPDVLGNIRAFDPAIGIVSLITARRMGVDHDR